MCGIIGYTGAQNATPILMEGLSRLEYRGYDSAGVSLLLGGTFATRKAKGRLAALSARVAESPLPFSDTGIAHTRWATHGAPSDANAHPHTCGRVTLVHNGIVENYGEISEALKAEGVRFASETDTERIACLLDREYDGDAIGAICRAQKQLRGSYALAILFADQPQTVYAVREGSPLLVGYGGGENFVASDLTALLPHTCRYTDMESGEIAVLRADGVSFFNFRGEPVKKAIQETELTAADAEKGGYAHFMRKEIHEQPEAIRRTVTPYLQRDPLEGVPRPHRIVLIACGSAMHACLCGKRFLEGMARIPCEVFTASEFRYGDPILTEDTLAVAVSQSGETADTLAALRLCREKGVLTVALVNVATSSIAREADRVLLTLAGPEIAVATTKAYTAQVALLAVMAMHLAHRDPTVCASLPDTVQSTLAGEEACAAMARHLTKAHDVFFIGRGRDFDVCAEGSLKLKEISYLHSEAYAAGELKHGTISLVGEGTPVIALITDAARKDKTVANMREVKARGARIYLLLAEGAGEVPDDAYDEVLLLPTSDSPLAVIPAAVAMQMIAYHTALLLGRDIDKPRNLAKSVTVE